MGNPLTTFILLISVLLCEAFTRPGLVSGSCTLSFIKSMRAYDCAGLNLSEIPQYMPSSTEIIDASMNRLRELKSNSFRKYTSLKKLYLNDNMIMSIHSSTFEKLTSLQSLDLSMNVLFEVPTQLFHMSSLEELFLGQNPRLDIFGLINNSVPISAPIKYLDISYSPMLTHLPEFGTFMDLVHLNVSGNSLKDLTMSSFIGLCNLRYFTGENLTVEFVNPCSCKQVDAWFNQTNVRTFPPFFHRCLYVNHECYEDFQPDNDASIKHEMCKLEFQARETVRNISKICYIVFGIIGVALLVIGICYFYYKSQKLPDIEPKNRMNNEKTEALLTPNNNSI